VSARTVRRAVAVAGTVGLASVTGAARLRAQPRVAVRCTGQIVNDVVVITQPPYTSGLLGRVAMVGRAVRKLHATTQPELIQRFLLLRRGDRWATGATSCDARRASASCARSRTSWTRASRRTRTVKGA
jgi:hypothetical protein